MNRTLTIDARTARDGIAPILQLAAANLTSRIGLNRFIGRRVVELCRQHFIEKVQTRHKTATELGAKPSGFWDMEKTGLALGECTDEHASVALRHPGIARAFGDVKITPGEGKKALTIPLNALAYGKRAKDLWDEYGLFIPKRKNPDDEPIIASQDADGKIHAWYLSSPTFARSRTAHFSPMTRTSWPPW